MKLLFLLATLTATAVFSQIPSGSGGGGVGATGPAGPTGPAGTLGTVVSYSSSHPVAQSDCGNSITASASLTFTFPITITPPCQLYVISTSASATISTALSGGATYNLGTTPLPTFGPISGTVATGQVFTEDAAGNWHSAAGPTGATGATGPSGSTVRTIGFVWSSASALTTGAANVGIIVSSACTLNSWDIDTLPNDTATIQTWKVATGTTHPVVGNSISTSGVAISTGGHVHSTTMTDFTTTAVTAFDVFNFNLSAVGGTATTITFTLGMTCP